LLSVLISWLWGIILQIRITQTANFIHTLGDLDLKK